MPKATPLITCRPETAEPGSAGVRPEAETKGHRLWAVRLRLAMLAPCCIRGAAILRDPPADQTKDANGREILFHHERDRGPGAALRRRVPDGNGSDRASAEGRRASQTSAPRNMRFARAIRRVWTSPSTSERTSLRPADVRW